VNGSVHHHSGAARLRDVWLWIGVSLYAALFFSLGALRYAAHANFVDLGIFAQTASSAFGCFCNAVEGSHWSYHFSPILFLAGALMRVWPSALALIALQAVAGALVAPPIYAIVAVRAGRPYARLAAGVVLLYPPLAGIVFNDFHENGLAPAAIAWLLWAFDAGYGLATVLFALLALSIKEDQAIFLTIAGIGGAIALRSDRKRAALSLAVAMLAAGTLAAYLIAFHPRSAQRFYAWSPHDWALLFPGGVLERIGFLLLAFLPLLFLPFRVWAGALLATPLAEVLFSRMSTTYTLGSHYAGVWAGYALFAFGLAVAAVASQRPNASRVLYACLALCIVEFAVADPLHPRAFLHWPAARDSALDRFLDALPARIDVATQEEAYTHLAARDPSASLLPERPQPLHACFILIDRDFPASVRLLEAGPAVKRAAAAGAYAIASHQGAIILYKARSCAPAPR